MESSRVRTELKNTTMIAHLNGEIDHHSASEIKAMLDIHIEGAHPSLLILDFSEISFMDSSGIGLVMGRYKIMKYLGGNLKIENPSPQIKKIMNLAGFDKLKIMDVPKNSKIRGEKID